MPDIARVSSLPRISPSSISDLECARRHWTLRVKKEWPDRPMIGAVAFGVAVHSVARLAYLYRDGDRPCLEHISAWSRTAVWAGRWPEGTDREAETERVIAAVCALVANDDGDPASVEGILDLETQIEHPHHHKGEPLFVWSCKVDRVFCRRDTEPDVLVVRDYKTTRPRIDLREAYIQCKLAKRLHPEYKHVKLEYLWLADEDGRVAMDVVHDTDLRGVHATVVQAALKVLLDPEHTPSPGECCIYCPLRNSCEAVRLPAPLQEA